jgi:hypothetical protein
MADPNVLRVNCVEEEAAFRCAAQEVISRILADKPGRTLIDIAERIDVSVKTISNAFNRTHSLSQTFLNRLGKAYGPHVLDPVAKLSGGRMVPLEVQIERDILPLIGRANLKIVEARDPAGPGGAREVPQERAGYLPDLIALQKEIGALICQIERELAA